jgi:glycosyltransferase involved in cell wall biosynthesis
MGVGETNDSVRGGGSSQVTRSTKPRVALDLHLLGSCETGNETYARELAKALCARGTFDYMLYVPNKSALPSELFHWPVVREIGHRSNAVRLAWQYPRRFIDDGASLVHMPTYVRPPWLRCACVVTIHDMSFEMFSDQLPVHLRMMLKALVRFSIRTCARVMTVSEASRRDIIRIYNVPPERIVVTPLAAAPIFSPQRAGEIARVRNTYGLCEKYVLAVGTVQPRKNLDVLIRAFSIVANEVPSHQLVIVGQSGWRGSMVYRAVDAAGLGGRVCFTGYVPEKDLPALYAGAEVFCHPSLYEGFGLPPLEAMACGTATITSSAGSLPEVVGDGARMFPATSVSDLAAVLWHLLRDPHARRDLAGRGRARAASFTWDRTARLTEEVFRSVLQGVQAGGF